MTIVDRVLALLGLCLLVAYLAILVSYVAKPALTIVCIIGVAGAAFDFGRTFFGARGNNNGA